MKVDSSFIRDVDWKDKIMKVYFRNGTIVTYYHVPEEEYTRFVASPSVGRYYHLNIKGKYPEN